VPLGGKTTLMQSWRLFELLDNSFTSQWWTMYQLHFTICKTGMQIAVPKILNRLWPVIDDELRNAAFNRQIHVRVLMSRWSHTNKDIYPHLHSLAALNARLPCRRYRDPNSWVFCCLNRLPICSWLQRLLREFVGINRSADVSGAGCGKSIADPLFESQSQQVHGDGQHCLHRSVHPSRTITIFTFVQAHLTGPGTTSPSPAVLELWSRCLRSPLDLL
jgi:hypothetical protein